MRHLTNRIAKLEDVDRSANATPLRVYVLDENDPLPEGETDPDDPALLIIRLVSP